MVDLAIDVRAERWIPAGTLILMGFSLGGLLVEFLATHPDPVEWWRIEILITAGISAAVIYSGYWLLNSDYTAAELWVILGWSVVGLVTALVLASGIYVHQLMEQVVIAEPTFLFEFLALTGAGLGVIFGLNWRMRSQRPPKPVVETAESTDPDSVQTALSLLIEDVDGVQQRWTLMDLLLSKRTLEVPIRAFVVQLARTDAFPDDESEVESIIYEDHLPMLVESGVIEIDNEIDTIRYVGPDEYIDEFPSIRSVAR